MIDLFKRFPRSFATILVLLLEIITNGATNFTDGLDFFTDVFAGMPVGIGVGLSFLLTWIGDRVLLNFNVTPTLTTAISVLSAVTVILFGAVGGYLSEFILSLGTGQLALGGVIGTLIKIFGDRSIDIFTDAETV